VRALVCGGAGFIGSHLVDRLLREGHQVLVIDDLSNGRAENLAEALDRGACDLVQLSILDPSLAEAVRAAAPEVVFNLAAQIDIRHSIADPIHDATTNVVGTVAVLEAARKAGARKVVLASSVAIYGPPPALPVTEQTPNQPLSPYATSKLTGELYLRQFQALYGISTTTLVLTNTYGPRQSAGSEAGAVAIFADAMIDGRPTRIFGDGSNTRDYLYVDDAVDAFYRAARPVGDGKRLNIATGVPTTDLELHATVATAVGGAPPPTFEPSRLGDIRHMVVGSGAARMALDWAPCVALADGVARTVEALRRSRRPEYSGGVRVLPASAPVTAWRILAAPSRRN
jgi:UDP-glucose 4-epimerase